MWLFSTSLSRVTDLFCRHAEDLKMSESGSERGSAPSTISFKSARSDRSKGNVPVFGIKPKSSRKRWDYHVNSSVEILFCNQGKNHNIVYMQTWPLSPVNELFVVLLKTWRWVKVDLREDQRLRQSASSLQGVTAPKAMFQCSAVKPDIHKQGESFTAWLSETDCCLTHLITTCSPQSD